MFFSDSNEKFSGSYESSIQLNAFKIESIVVSCRLFGFLFFYLVVSVMYESLASPRKPCGIWLNALPREWGIWLHALPREWGIWLYALPREWGIWFWNHDYLYSLKNLTLVHVYQQLNEALEPHICPGGGGFELKTLFFSINILLFSVKEIRKDKYPGVTWGDFGTYTKEQP
jgi:hypothetical protein